MFLASEFFNRIIFLISSIGVTIGFFFGFILLLKKKNKANIFLAFFLLVFSLRMAKSLFYGYYNASPVVHYLFLSSLLTIGPSLWFYTLTMLKKPIKNNSLLIHYLPFVIFILISSVSSFYESPYFYLGIFFHGLAYCFSIFYLIYKTSNLKKWLFILTTVTTLMFVNSILIFFGILDFYPSSALLFSFIILLMLVYGLNNLWLFLPNKEKYAESNLDLEKANEYYKKLKKLIEIDKLYLDPELSLTKLSKLIGISSKELSQVINQIKKINYSQYIAYYRVEEAKKRLKNPKYKNYKISSIAYESGFNSISSFNNTFKKITNTTAVKYRDS